MKQPGTRVFISSVVLAISTLLASQSVAYASGPSVSGGGVVDGPLGTTSQLGFTASSYGGEFLCVMAGRSGGFAFGPWTSVSQMQVKGSVSGPVTVSGGIASLSGTATVHVVGKTSTGEVLTATGPDVPNVSQAPNGDRVAITGRGTIGVNPKSAQGAGTFTHKTSSGTILATGAWRATELLEYQSYGCGVVHNFPTPGATTPLPPFWC